MPLMSCVFPDGFWGANTEVSGHGWMTKSFISTRQSEEGLSLSSAYCNNKRKCISASNE